MVVALLDSLHILLGVTHYARSLGNFLEVGSKRVEVHVKGRYQPLYLLSLQIHQFLEYLI